MGELKQKVFLFIATARTHYRNDLGKPTLRQPPDCSKAFDNDEITNWFLEAPGVIKEQRLFELHDVPSMFPFAGKQILRVGCTDGTIINDPPGIANQFPFA